MRPRGCLRYVSVTQAFLSQCIHLLILTSSLHSPLHPPHRRARPSRRRLRLQARPRSCPARVLPCSLQQRLQTCQVSCRPSPRRADPRSGRRPPGLPSRRRVSRQPKAPPCLPLLSPPQCQWPPSRALGTANSLRQTASTTPAPLSTAARHATPAASSRIPFAAWSRRPDLSAMPSNLLQLKVLGCSAMPRPSRAAQWLRKWVLRRLLSPPPHPQLRLLPIPRAS